MCDKKQLVAGYGRFNLSCVLILLLVGCGTTRPPPDFSPISEADREPVKLLSRLSPGDTVVLEFPGAPKLNAREKLGVDGTLNLPMLGMVKVEGLTEAELKAFLTEKYKPQLQINEVNVMLVSPSNALVTGAVLRPGKIMLERPLTALESIMEAGGFDSRIARVDRVVVIRTGESGRKSFLLNFSGDLKGEVSKPFYLRPDDIIYVPAKQILTGNQQVQF